MAGIDEVLDGGKWGKDIGEECIEVEVFRLLEEAELPSGQRGEDGAQAAAEATAMVVGEFLMDLGLKNGVHVVREFGFLGGAISVGGVVVFLRRWPSR